MLGELSAPAPGPDANTTVVEVAGASMTPTLPVGARAFVARVAAAEVAPGDVVLIGSDPHPILHRVLHVARVGDRIVVLHRGDAGGGIGVADGGAVLGKAIAVLESAPGPTPSLATLSPRLRRSSDRARRRARLAAFGVHFGLRRRSRPWWAQRAAAWLLR